MSTWRQLKLLWDSCTGGSGEAARVRQEAERTAASGHQKLRGAQVRI